MSIKISITGDLASGKSTLSSSLSRELGLEQISVGALVRELAKAQNIDILEANNKVKAAWMDRQVDDAVEMKIKEVEANQQPYIIDARVGFHYAPNSLKIKLITHPTIAADRAFSAARESEDYKTWQEAYDALQARRNLERHRFIERYEGKDIDDLSNFNLVIDTSFILKEHTVEIVQMALKAKEAGNPFPKFWCHPGQIILGDQNSSDYREDKARAALQIMSEGKFDFLQGITAIRTNENDILVQDGNHRTIAANVTSLPYIGLELKPHTALPDLRTVARNMYDYYEAMNYHAGLFLKENPDRIPFWGAYKKGENNDLALNKYKFNFAERAFGLPLPPIAPSPSA